MEGLRATEQRWKAEKGLLGYFHGIFLSVEVPSVKPR